MAIIKDEIDPKRGYTVTSNKYALDGNLSLAAKGLLLMLYVLPSNWSVSCSGLAKFTSNCKDFINQTLRELEDAHYVRAEAQDRKRGRFGGLVYHLVNYPDDAVSSEAVLPHPASADTVTPDTVLSSLLSSDKSTEKQIKKDVSNTFINRADGYGRKKVRRYDNFDTADFFKAALRRTYGELKIEG